MPRTVKAAPDDRKIMPSLRLGDVKTEGSVDFDPLLRRRCKERHLQRGYMFTCGMVIDGCESKTISISSASYR